MIQTPYYLIDKSKLLQNMEKIATLRELSGAKAALLPLPLAPTDEQTRVVAKLEELLSDLDAGVAELKAAQKKLAQYRQSLLKAAVEGALTADWRADGVWMTGPVAHVFDGWLSADFVASHL